MNLTPTDLRTAIRQERLRLFMKEIIPHLAGSLFGVLLILGIFHEQSSTTATFLWLSTHVLLSAGAAILIWVYYRQDNPDSLRWRPLIYAMGLAWGLGWALAPPLFLATKDPVFIVTLICILIGVCASPAITFALFLPAYLLFITPLMAALTWQVAQLPFGQSLIIKLLIPVFWAFLVGYAFNLRRLLIDSIRLRIENAEAFARARAADQAKNRFLAAASHDIRQPLQALHLFSNALENDLRNDSNQHLFTQMRASLQNMSDLLTSLLDVARLDTGQIVSRPQHLSLGSLCETLAEEQQPLARQKGLTLTCSVSDEVVVADPIILRRIIGNLLSNALRYTQDGRVILHSQRDGESVRLTVDDTGPGIADDQRELIFEEFVQLDNPARDRQKGLGLGLNIVKRLCRIEGIDMSLDSAPGQGARFSLALRPGDATQIASATSPVRAPTDLTGTHVLVVDDEAAVREGLSLLLEGWGASVRAADSESTALACCKAAMPDLIISDVRLADGDGPALVKACRRQCQHSIPAVLLTGETDPTELTRLKETGLPLLHKPVRAPQLRLAMHRLLKAASSE